MEGESISRQSLNGLTQHLLGQRVRTLDIPLTSNRPGRQGQATAHLLHCCQALELCAAEVLLLQGRRLQHEVLLLGRVHLLQVLRRRAGLPVQGLLDHLRGVGEEAGYRLATR